MWAVPIRNWKVPDELQLPTLIWMLWLFITRMTFIGVLFYIRVCLGTAVLISIDIMWLEENF